MGGGQFRQGVAVAPRSFWGAHGFWGAQAFSGVPGFLGRRGCCSMGPAGGIPGRPQERRWCAYPERGMHCGWQNRQDFAPKVRTIKPRPQPGRRGRRLPPLDRVNVRPIYTPPEPRPPPRTRPLRSPARPSVATKYCAAQAPVLSRGFRGRFESAAHSRKVRFFFRGNSTSAACIRKYPKHRGDLFRGV